jgi:hypothetical protein
MKDILMVRPILLEIAWYQVLGLVFSGGVGGVVLYILGWIRYRKKDKSEIELAEGEFSIKEATADKIKAEANQLTKQTEISVADAALKITERLSIQLEAKDKELDSTQEELNNVRSELFEMQRKSAEVNQRCEKLQRDLDHEKDKNRELIGEVEQLRLQLEKIKRSQSGNRGPG